MPFRYGDPHPDPVALQARREQTARRFATHYRDVLREARRLYWTGGDDTFAAFNLFDTERANICQGQAWSARHGHKGPDVAELCRDYALSEVNILQLRLTPQERICWLEAAFEACRKIEDQLGQCDAKVCLGNAYLDLGTTDEAIDSFQAALAHAADSWKKAQILGRLGAAYYSLENATEARDCYEAALSMMGGADRRLRGQLLGSLGAAHIALLNPPEGIRCYRESLDIARELRDVVSEMRVSGYLGNALRFWRGGEQLQGAIDLLCTSVRLALTIGDQHVAAESARHLVGALKLAHPHKVEGLCDRAKLALTLLTELGDDPKADSVRTMLAEWRGEVLPSCPDTA